MDIDVNDSRSIPFHELFSAAQTDQSCMMAIIERFDLYIKKLSRRLAYEDAYQDLLLKLVSIIRSDGIDSMKNTSDGAYVRYVIVSLTHEYVKLSKGSFSDSRFEKDGSDFGVFEAIEFWISCETILNEDEYTIIWLEFHEKWTIMEIARHLSLSRPTVYKKNRIC